MRALFQYNWQVREDWYRWCEEVSEEALLQKRIGGVGGILQTLFHIIDVEWSWIRIIQGKPDFQENFNEYQSLERVKELDARFKQEVEEFVCNWESAMEARTIEITEANGSVVTYSWGEIMRHIIAHEIHHIGQLSVWAREIGKRPVSANFIDRGLVPTK